MASSMSWVRRPVLGGHDVAVFATAFAVLLSIWAVILVHGQTGGTVGASIAVLAMIAPVAFARQAPLAAAFTLVAATLLNGLVFGQLVRCGPALPAAFYVAYVLGNRTVGWVRAIGITAVVGAIGLQCVYDPRLEPFADIVTLAPPALLFFGAGMAVRSRAAMVTRLRERNTELREQREQTARLAVETDRARIRTDLDDGLRTRIHEITIVADAARASSDQIDTSLATIEAIGRDALDRMRDIVGTMRLPINPEPGLKSLAELVETATTADVRLTVHGQTRVLPASIELSGYRIVEHLMSALEDDPSVRAEVRIAFEPETLELYVAGPPARDREVANALAVVRDRVALHGGAIETTRPSHDWQARVRLPLVTRHA